MKKFLLAAVSAFSLCACATENITQTSAVFYRATDTGPGEAIGQVLFRDTDKGLRIDVAVFGLAKNSTHGFHIHEHADCGPVLKDGKAEHAMAAGGHYDPEGTGKHLGPEGGGHKGDLPRLQTDANGKVHETFYVKGVLAADFKNRAAMIHAGGDNYSDRPVPLGGGGARIACGIVE